MTNRITSSGLNYISPFGLEREMGYTFKEFFKVLPRALSDYDYKIDSNLIIIELENGKVEIEIGDERERRYTKLVSFPILPVKISFIDVEDDGKAHFLRKFDISYMKGLA